MRLDPHIHTEYSLDGIDSPVEILDYVKRYTSLDAIAFTDHNRLFSRRWAEELTRESGILVIPGVELGHLNSSKHIIALDLDEVDVKGLLKSNDPHEAVEYVSAQGGLSIAAHPVPRGYSNFSEVRFDAVEAINGGCPQNNRLIRNISGMPEIGSSDAHIKCQAGRAWTDIDIEMPRFGPGTEAREVRRFTGSLMEAIRKGYCRASGEKAARARHLNYGLLVGRKYFRKSLNAVCSLML